MHKNIRNALRRAKSKTGALVATVAASALPVVAFAQTGPVDQVKGVIDTMKTDGISIATAVVVAVWSITAIFMLRRKG